MDMETHDMEVAADKDSVPNQDVNSNLARTIPLETEGLEANRNGVDSLQGRDVRSTRHVMQPTKMGPGKEEA